MKAIEPTLAGTYGGYFTESDSTGDIHKFTNGLVAAIERLGVTVWYGQSVAALQADGTSATVVVDGTSGPEVHTFDGVVVCAGVGGKPALCRATGRPREHLPRSRVTPSPSTCWIPKVRRQHPTSVCSMTRPNWSQPSRRRSLPRGGDGGVQRLQQGYPCRPHPPIGGVGTSVLPRVSARRFCHGQACVP